MSRRPEKESSDEFGPALAELKRQGCAFLVAGDVPASVHADACRQFLGDGGDGRRVLAVSCDGFGAASTPGEDTTVLQYRGPFRSATASADGAAAGMPGRTAEDLEELGLSVLEEVEAYEAMTPDPAPGGLRVALASAAPLVAEYGDERIFGFLHLLTARVREPDGMAFVHLPVDVNSAELATYRPLFDGVIELRVAGGGCQQRWHLPGTTSDWLDC